MELGGWILGNRFGKTGGRRAHDVELSQFWRRPPGQTLGDSTPLLEEASERNDIEKREGCTQERLYMSLSAISQHHMRHSALNFE